MLVELGLVEQRFQAVLEVLNDGATVTDVARRYGVARQTVHEWLRKYAARGLGGLADRSSRPLSCPHQMAPALEVRIVAMRREHPGWGPRTILFWLERDGVDPLPGRTSVERCLIRHGLVTPQARKRKRSDYKRWERSRCCLARRSFLSWPGGWAKRRRRSARDFTMIPATRARRTQAGAKRGSSARGPSMALLPVFWPPP
jgi:Homeodomain-like domain